jgi:hypothetical protein
MKNIHKHQPQAPAVQHVERSTLVTNFYEFLLQKPQPKLYQYKVTTMPKVDKDKFAKIRWQLIANSPEKNEAMQVDQTEAVPAEPETAGEARQREVT